MRYATVFAIVVGLGMIGQWTFSYVSGQIPELADEPIRIWFHICAEFVTAVCLLVSGVAFIRKLRWAKNLYFISMGMLFYTAIVSPGYFAQKGDWMWLGLFSVLIIGGLVSLPFVYREETVAEAHKAAPEIK